MFHLFCPRLRHFLIFFQFASDDCDDEELCNLATEFEDRECNHGSSDSSNAKFQAILHTNVEYTSGGCKDTVQCDFDWDDEWDNDPFLDVHVPHASDGNEGAGTPTKSLLKQSKRRQEGGHLENKENTSVEPLECGIKESTLNGAERIAVTSLSNQVIGNLANYPIGKDGLEPCESCGRLSLEKCCSCGNKLAIALDEDVSDWLEEDSISDLELSFAAEEVESTTYQ